MKNMTFTNDQAALIVAQWNELAVAAYQMTPDQCHLLFHDTSDDEIAEQGYTSVEMKSFIALNGQTTIIDIFDYEVTLTTPPET